jgi:tRNA pseudouridine32 synthase/23S rRNA pseudouridine746 synthase
MTPANLSPEEIAFVRSLVIHEDADILVLNKPPGLSSQGGRIAARTLDDLLAAFARSNGKRPRLVHRLDRDTSGLILTGRTQPDAAFLGKAMMGRRIRKTYLAIVGPAAPSPLSGMIDVALRRHEQGRETYMRVAQSDDPLAQTASTRYRTLTANPIAALVELSPQTGRMHQLRVHLASIGKPIIGDARYGRALVLGGAPAKRVMLHAAALSFPHPAGGERRLSAPPPRDFLDLLKALDLDASSIETASIRQSNLQSSARKGMP